VQGECEENEGDGRMHMTLRLASVMCNVFEIFAICFSNQREGSRESKDKRKGNWISPFKLERIFSLISD
jgi:hypothetical protein